MTPESESPMVHLTRGRARCERSLAACQESARDDPVARAMGPEVLPRLYGRQVGHRPRGLGGQAWRCVVHGVVECIKPQIVLQRWWGSKKGLSS